MNQEKESGAFEKDAAVQGADDLKDAVRTEQSRSAAEVMNSSRGRSTGPRTERGKKISARNALKLGFFARELRSLHISCEEDRQEFVRLLDGFIDYWEPIGQSELVQVELMVIALHQDKCLLRLARAWGRSSLSTNSLDDGNSEGIDLKLEAWLNELPPLDELEKFQRCEAHILRNYHRAMSELQRLQEMRLGKRVLPRLYVDINNNPQ